MTPDEAETLANFADRLRRHGTDNLTLCEGMIQLTRRGIQNTETAKDAHTIRNAFPGVI